MSTEIDIIDINDFERPPKEFIFELLHWYVKYTIFWVVYPIQFDVKSWALKGNKQFFIFRHNELKYPEKIVFKLQVVKIFMLSVNELL